MTTKLVFKLWFGWHVGRIEDYLEEMALKGWRLEKVGCSQLVFRFVKGEPRKVRYCVDFRPKADMEYKRLLADDGWELTDESVGWLLWAKEYEGERPQIYTDRESLIERNKRLIYILIFALVMQVPALTINLNRMRTEMLGQPLSDAMRVFVLFYAIMVFFLILGLVRLILANRRLKGG